MRPSIASPPTERVLAVLDLLASAPAREFTLTEIVAALGINKATAHAVLSTMTARGYLVRNTATKGYVLGAGALLAGRAAERANPALKVARQSVPQAATDLGMECVASVIDDDVITVIEWSPAPGAATSTSPWSHTGQRVPLVPPFGAALIAWSDAQRVERWIARADTATDPQQLRESLASIRSRGFDVQLDDSRVAAFRTSLAGLDLDRLSASSKAAVAQLVGELGSVEYLPEKLSATRRYAVNALAAPVFGIDGAPVLTLSVHPRDVLRGGAVDAAGRRLREIADSITVASGGTQPK